MSTWLRTLIPLVASALCSTAWSAEITVAPGSGTLAMAIGGAASGDTLLLQDGGYSGSVTVNKSLTIRAVNRATNAVVYGPVTIDGPVPFDAPGITVTLQGLKFSGDVNLTRAVSIRLLENEWLSGGIDSNNYKTSEGDGSLVIVGNRLAGGSKINDIYSDGAYIAGNTLMGGWIATYAYVWIVGNKGGSYNSAYDHPAILSGPTGGSAMILGNRVECNVRSGVDGCIYARSPFNLIAGNIAVVNDTAQASYADQPGIYASGSVEVLNNVVQGLNADADRSGPAIAVYGGGARVAGNIAIDWVSKSDTPIYVDSFAAEVTHNLCFNTSWGCPMGSGNLDANPKLVDRVDFKRAAGSPAIDAGPPDDGLADLNRTRNDMGVHGGPWDIAQYDVQRDPSSVGPFVYPLFKAGGYLSGGMLDVKALGVARLR